MLAEKIRACCRAGNVTMAMLAGGLMLGLALGGSPTPARAAAVTNAELLQRMERMEKELKGVKEELRKEKEARKQAEKASQAREAKLAKRGGTTVRSGKKNISLELSGQVDRAYLYADDGTQTNDFFVDNDSSSTRVRFLGRGRFDKDLSVGTNIEVQIESNTSSGVSQLNNDTGNVGFTQRKLEFYFDSKRFGRLWLGHGDTASNFISEQDLSGVAVSGLFSNLTDQAGGLIFATEMPRPTGQNPISSKNPTIKKAFKNLDGFSRRDRVRYDTPKVMGFKASVGAVEGGRSDASLRYASKLGRFKVASAVGFAHRDHVSNIYAGSVSVLDTSGLNLTFAAGVDDNFNPARNNRTFWYVKGGYQFKVFDFGGTAVAFDYYNGTDINVNGDTSDAYGAALVQEIDSIATELFVSGRVYGYDQGGQNFHDIVAVLSGARVKF